MIRPDLHRLLPLNPAASAPLYRQIYLRFRTAIVDGLLLPGERIPAARALAQELGVARGTVESAYALLGAEGYVETRGQAGTVVASGIRPSTPARPIQQAHHRTSVLALPAMAPLAVTPGRTVPPFQMGVPALDAFPRKIWSRLAARSIRATTPNDMLYPPPAGLASLRNEIATYLQLSRGVQCAPTQVFITAGYRETLQLVTHALLRSGDKVWVEDPGYAPTAQLLTQAGMTPVAVAVDGEGMQVDYGLAQAPRARAAIVTPAHQSPLCVSLSLPRRFALLDWATRTGGWIVEDDYDGEYRYVSRPLPALKSLDSADRVLYLGTFSKVLFPGIRLAYLVVPESQIARFEQVCRTLVSGSPALTQSIVRDFIAEGHFSRHLQRMRKLYGERRKMAAEGLGKVLDRYLRVDEQPGGMHLILRMRGRRSDRELATRMRNHALYASCVTERAIEHPVTPALLLGFTNVDSVATAEKLGQQIVDLIQAKR